MKKDSLYYKIFFDKSKLRLEILKIAKKEDIVQIYLVKKLNKQKPQINIIIKDLIKENLIFCVNEKDRRYKRYSITNLGKEILKQIEKLEK